MLRSAHIKVDILPIMVGFLAHKSLRVVRIHVAKVIGRAACKARHGVQFQGEHRLLVNPLVLHHALIGLVPRPFLRASQRWLATFSGLIFVDFGQFEGQTSLRNHVGKSILIINGEGFAPITLP